MAWGLLAALSCKAITPVNEPSAAGVNVTPMVQVLAGRDGRARAGGGGHLEAGPGLADPLIWRAA